MKTKIILLLLTIFSQNLFSQQIDFKTPKPIDSRIIATREIFFEDVNNDGITDIYSYLQKGDSAKTGEYDPLIQDGFYLSIRDANLKLKTKKLFLFIHRVCGVEDMNNDGKKDVISNENGQIYIYYRKDSILFDKKIVFDSANYYFNDIMVNDLNNDGKMDISLSFADGNRVMTLMQTKTDTFTRFTLPFLGINNAGTGTFKVADLNHDNKKDFVLYYAGNGNQKVNKFFIYYQVDSINYTYEQVNFPGLITDMVIFDHNHDGLNDILIENIDFNKNNLLLFPQSFSGPFNKNYSYPCFDSSSINTSYGQRLTVEDLNCDGYPEVYYLVNPNNRNSYVFDMKIDTGFAHPKELWGIKIHSYDPDVTNRFIDWNGDGRKDMLIDNTYSSYWASNNCINNTTSLVYLKTVLDTVISNIKDGKTGLTLKSLITFDRNDTTYQWNRFEDVFDDPNTGGKIPGWRKMRYIVSKGKSANYYLYEVFTHTLYKVQGTVCGVSVNDTFQRLNFYYYLKSFIGLPQEYRYWTSYISVAESLTDPSSISFSKENSIHIFPNPASETITVKTDIPNLTLRLYNLQGQEFPLIPKEKFMYDVTHLNNGIYLLQYSKDGSTAVEKIVVQKE